MDSNFRAGIFEFISGFWYRRSLSASITIGNWKWKFLGNLLEIYFPLCQVIMNRIATLLDANAGRFNGEIDSEWVMGRHIDSNNISVRISITIRREFGIPRDKGLYRLNKRASLRTHGSTIRKHFTSTGYGCQSGLWSSPRSFAPENFVSRVRKF